MGQNISIPGPAVQRQHSKKVENKASPAAPSSMFDFILLWLGGRMHPNAVSLPKCWDELLDWTEDATVMTALLRESNLCEIPTNDDTDRSSTTAPDERIRYKSPKFTPLVLKGDSKVLDELPGMTWMQRASLYSESVVIAVETAPKQCSYLLSPIQFSTYHALVCRLGDLLALSRLSLQSKDSSSKPTADADALVAQSPAALGECLICLNHSKNTVLPCGHELCEACEKRWVRKKLVCPFCRHKFSSAKQVSAGGYHVAEWSNLDLDVERDMCVLGAHIDDFWATIQKQQPFQIVSDVLMEPFVAAPRTIRFASPQDGFIVIDCDEPQQPSYN